MNITEDELRAEVIRAAAAWPFISSTESAYRLPPRLLYAVGSRETNLTNEVGDGGHGHGVWQLDDRSHTIPAGFDQNVKWQCLTAASMLRDLLTEFGGDLRAALAAYNAGAGTVAYSLAHGLDVDTGTAGGDYSLDTEQRMQFLQRAFPDHAVAEEADMRIVTYEPPAGGKPKFPVLIGAGATPVTIKDPAKATALAHAGVPAVNPPGFTNADYDVLRKWSGQ